MVPRKVVTSITALLTVIFSGFALSASATSVYSQLSTFNVTSDATDIAFSLDGSTAFISQGNNSNCSIAVIATSTYSLTSTINVPCGSTDSIGTLKMMPNGTTLWAATDKVMYAIDVATFVVSVIIDGTSTSALHFRGFSFSSDSSSAFISTLQAAVYRVNTSTGATTYTYNIASFASQAGNAVVSPNGSFLLVTSTGPTSKVISFPLTSYGYDPANSVTLTGTAYSIVISPDSSHVFVAQGITSSPPTNFGIYHATTALAGGSVLPTSSMPKSLSISPDGTTVLSAQVGMNFSTVDVSTLVVIDHNLSGYSASTVAAFNPTGSSALLAQNASSVILPLGITPPVGPGTPSPSPTPVPSPNTLPDTGWNGTEMLFLLASGLGIVVIGFVVFLSSMSASRKRIRNSD